MTTLAEKPVTLAPSWLRKPRYFLPLLSGALLLAIYLTFIRPFLMPDGATVYVQLALAGALLTGIALAAFVFLGLSLVTLVVTAWTRQRERVAPWLHRLGRAGATVLLLLISLSIVVAISQRLAYTPPLLGADGQPVPDSIATLEKMNLNGSEQWVMIRGQNVNNPVLLFLHGGPGVSEMAKMRGYADYLEENFVVVSWDQPGAGKSYGAVDVRALTPEMHVAYARELALQLRERFGEEKIYVLGDSWGSALGILLVQAHPELFHAFIGTGQMVAFVENDVLMYNFALQSSLQRGDTATFTRLIKQGPPPYYGAGVARKMLDLAAATDTEMSAQYNKSGYNLLTSVLLAPEFGLYDKAMNVINGLRIFDVLYPQLYDIDFRTQATRLEVPVYFLVGRHDINAIASLAEDYYQMLAAPHKELIWFERSGHNVLTEEGDKVADVMVNRVLAQTAP